MEASAEGNLEVFQEGFAPGYREGPARLGQDAQGLWPLAGATEVKITKKRWGVGGAVLTRGLAAHSVLGGFQGPMPLVCPSLRDNRAMEKELL